MARLERIIPYIALIASPIFAATAPAQPATVDTLRLETVQALVDARSPMLVASRSRVEALRAMERSATLPPDPQLQLGVMNASLPDLSTRMPTSMAPSIQLMQMVPMPAKLSRSGAIARATTAIAQSESLEIRWMTRTAAAAEFHTLYRVDRQIDTMKRTLRLLQHAESIARSMYRTGEAPQTDVLRASVEIARMEAEVSRMSAMRVGAAARLNAILGRAADDRIEAVSAPTLLDLPPVETLMEWSRESNPSLGRGREEVARAASRTELARLELWPELTVGIQYGQRDGEMGIERMGSLMFGISVPVFAGARQLRMRDEATAMARMAEAELQAGAAEVAAAVATLAAELQTTRSLLQIYRSDILPQAEGAATSALTAYRAGTVDFMTVVDAQMRLNQYADELFALEADYGRTVAELEMTMGRELTSISRAQEDR